MGQLAAPVPSAIALADWFLDEFENSDRPLASMALVLSDRTPATYTHATSQRDTPLPSGEVNDATAAVEGWITRTSSNQENQTAFSFAATAFRQASPFCYCVITESGA
jgi:hypothetical protein